MPGSQKVRALGSGGWDTPVMALPCPTPLAGTLRLHPGCSPSLEKQHRGHAVLPQPCRVTATLQHLCTSACTGTHLWVWLWLHGKQERTLPTTTSQAPPSSWHLLQPLSAVGLLTCGSVCGSKGLGYLISYPTLPSGSQTASRITAAPVFHKDVVAGGWEETLVQLRGERDPRAQRITEPFMGIIPLSPVARDPQLTWHRLCQAGPAVSPVRLWGLGRAGGWWGHLCLHRGWCHIPRATRESILSWAGPWQSPRARGITPPALPWGSCDSPVLSPGQDLRVVSMSS